MLNVNRFNQFRTFRLFINDCLLTCVKVRSFWWRHFRLDSGLTARPSAHWARSVQTPRSRRSLSGRTSRHRIQAAGDHGWSCDPDSWALRSAPAEGTEGTLNQTHHCWEQFRVIKSVGFLTVHNLWWLTWEYLHFWHLMLIGWGRSGSSLCSSCKIMGWTSSLSFSRCSTPNGTLVWTTRDGPRPGPSEDTHRHSVGHKPFLLRVAASSPQPQRWFANFPPTLIYTVKQTNRGVIHTESRCCGS